MIKSVIKAHYNYECNIIVYNMILMYFGLLWRRTFDSALKEFELSQGNFFLNVKGIMNTPIQCYYL